MPRSRTISSAALALAIAMSPAILQADEKGVIHDPDGYTNVRSAASTSAAVVARVNAGEVFDFTYDGPGFATWVKVKTKAGKQGYMHASRVMIHPSISELADTSPTDEINVYGKGAGIDYYPLARAAAKGDEKSLIRYFAITDTDGAAAETHFSKIRVVFHLAGDDRMARMLTGQSAAYRKGVKETLAEDFTFWPFESTSYLKQHFPKTAKVLFP